MKGRETQSRILRLMEITEQDNKMKKIVTILISLNFTLATLNSSAQAPISTPDYAGGGNALDFDGTSDYVNVPNIAAYDFGSGSFTYECWVELDAIGSGFNAIANSWTASSCISGPSITGWGITNDVNSKISFWIGDGNSSCGFNVATTGSVLSANEWVHIACVRNGNAMEIYIDGILSATTTTSRTLTGGLDVQIGKYYTSHPPSTSNIDGQIDEVRLWNVARSQAQIRDAMNRGLVGNETGLVGYWTMNEGTGSVVSDLTSNANDGTRL